MVKLKRILVPVDFSKGSLRAVNRAIELAKAVDGEVLVLYVQEPLTLTTTGDRYLGPRKLRTAIGRMRLNEQRRLTRLQRSLKPKRVPVTTILAQGDAAETICDTAKQERVDLIVMPTHGRTGLSRFFIGSVAEKVVRTAPCPVMTIRQAR